MITPGISLVFASFVDSDLPELCFAWSRPTLLSTRTGCLKLLTGSYPSLTHFRLRVSISRFAACGAKAACADKYGVDLFKRPLRLAGGGPYIRAGLATR